MTPICPGRTRASPCAASDNAYDDEHEHPTEWPDEITVEPKIPHPGTDPVEISTEPRPEHPERRGRVVPSSARSLRARRKATRPLG